MKMMRNYWSKWIAAAVLAAAVSGSPAAFAAKGDNSGAAEGRKGAAREKLQERLQQIASQLSLTDEQKEKLKPVFQEQFAKLREIIKDTTLSREEKAAKAKTLREEMAPKLKDILTAEQLEKWEKMREDLRGKLGEKLRERRGQR